MILVTGASGNVGLAVVDHLVAAGEPVRALTRGQSPFNFPAEVEFVSGDLSDSESLTEVFEGIDKLFLFTPPSGNGDVPRFAQSQGVKHIVLLSSIVTQKADPKTNVIAARHCAAEQAVLEAGLTWTFLRPDTFAANALEWTESIRAAGAVKAPYGQSLRCPIHEKDIAAVAVAALSQSGHEESAYWLTGPEPISVIEQVEAISKEINKPITFEELNREEALELMTQKMPKPAVERLLDYALKSIDTPPPISDAVKKVLGRPALTFKQWAFDHTKDFV